MELRKNQCQNCPFHSDPQRLALSCEKMLEIYSYLLHGTNHLCHNDRSNKTICAGGRRWQLEMWYSMGIISAPTNKALAQAMKQAGIKLAKHIA